MQYVRKEQEREKKIEEENVEEAGTEAEEEE